MGYLPAAPKFLPRQRKATLIVEVCQPQYHIQTTCPGYNPKPSKPHRRWVKRLSSFIMRPKRAWHQGRDSGESFEHEMIPGLMLLGCFHLPIHVTTETRRLTDGKMQSGRSGEKDWHSFRFPKTSEAQWPRTFWTHWPSALLRSIVMLRTATASSLCNPTCHLCLNN